MEPDVLDLPPSAREKENCLSVRVPCIIDSKRIGPGSVIINGSFRSRINDFSSRGDVRAERRDELTDFKGKRNIRNAEKKF